MADINNVTEGMQTVINTLPELYEDGIKETAKESGKVLALVPRAINAALAPVRIWIAKKEYNVAATEKLLAEKLENISAEAIVSPEPYVAVPALQAIAYCQDSEELRNMYANLLATSMVSEIKNDAHPSFVEIIKQLSPDEAKLLKRISAGDRYPLIDVNLYSSNTSYHPQIRNFTLLAEGICDYPQNVFAYIDNLARLKIIDIPAGIYFDNDEAYMEVENNELIQNILHSQLPEGQQWKIKRKVFEVTQYGKKFIDVCVKGV